MDPKPSAPVKPITPEGMIAKRDNDRLNAFLEDLRSLVSVDEDGSWVPLHDAEAILRQYAEQEPRNETKSMEAVTWVWPHQESRRAPTDVRLRMPMDLPVFGELRRPGAAKRGEGVGEAALPPKGYVFTLDAFAWGRVVHVKLVDENIQVYVADKLRTRKVYEGKRCDEADIHRDAKGR